MPQLPVSHVRCQSSSGSQEGALLSDTTGRRTKDPRLTRRGRRPASVGRWGKAARSRFRGTGCLATPSHTSLPWQSHSPFPSPHRSQCLPSSFHPQFPSAGGLLRWHGWLSLFPRGGQRQLLQGVAPQGRPGLLRLPSPMRTA